MAKRSKFDRIPRDLYQTWDPKAVGPLLPHLKPHTRFAEPCYGQGALSRQLQRAGHSLYWGSDISTSIQEPATVAGVPVYVTSSSIDALTLTVPLQKADCIITNPPWTRKKKNPILHKLIEHFIANSNYAWLLLDAGWAYTKQSADYMPYCSDIVAVGRVKWIPDTKSVGKDDCAWYRFSKDREYTVFHPRTTSLLSMPGVSSSLSQVVSYSSDQ